MLLTVFDSLVCVSELVFFVDGGFSSSKRREPSRLGWLTPASAPPGAVGSGPLYTLWAYWAWFTLGLLVEQEVSQTKPNYRNWCRHSLVTGR